MSLIRSQDSCLRILLGAGAIAGLLLPGVAGRAYAQQTTTPPSNPTEPAPSSTASPDPAAAESNPTPPVDPSAAAKDRIFGVIPNYTTVEGPMPASPVGSRQKFKMAALDSFDPFVYPMFGFVAGVNQLENQEPTWGRGGRGYTKRYGAAFADNTICSLVTTGLMPSLLKQDPRYFQRGQGSFASRLAYSASRSVVTRSQRGRRQFNLSEVAGTLVVAGISNLYYPAPDRHLSDTLMRWGSQAMWDTVANELKEFWPDIRNKIHGR